MAIILISTTDMRGPRGPEFARLLDSIERNASASLPVRAYILLQNCTQDELERVRAAAPACCALAAVPGRLSISAARNRLIETVLSEAAVGPDDVVGFPDDDCWLPDAVLARLATVFSERPDLDVLICRVSLDPDPRPFDAASVAPASARQIVRVSTSNNMFFRGSLIGRVGPFDPELGLGTPNGGGEDTDYVIRAFLRAEGAGIIDRALVGHPEPDKDCAAKYFRGALVVLARHARLRPALMREFLRKPLVGLYFVGRGKLSWSAYRAALAEGGRSFLKSRPTARAASA
ncbi:glycosyltransferase family 2 protein [Methylobacterium nigriterrae]|uniref:glycosyltransferase family 2 protein n=1 Tax=Methylobacterium nigriterrae TaxID=3127512 RepID=UPI003013D0AB